MRNCKRGDLEVTYNQLSCYHEHPSPLPQRHPILSSATLGFFQRLRVLITVPPIPCSFLSTLSDFFNIHLSSLPFSFQRNHSPKDYGHKPKTAWPAPLSSTAWPRAPLPRSLQRYSAVMYEMQSHLLRFSLPVVGCAVDPDGRCFPPHRPSPCTRRNVPGDSGHRADRAADGGPCGAHREGPPTARWP